MAVAVWYTGLLYLALVGLIAMLVVAMIIGYELLRRDFKRLARSNSLTENLERTLILQEQLGDLRHQVRAASEANRKELTRLWRQTDESLGDRLDRASDIVGQVRQSLGAINETSQRICRLGEQLGALSNALRLPPAGAAGGGELWLADLLGRMLPPQHYQLNVALGNGQPVDAVVRLGNFLVPIDAGFTATAPVVGTQETSTTRRGDSRKQGPEHPDLSGLEQSARQHVDRVAAECIMPDRGTVDFALMYLPTEALYYDLVIRRSDRADSFSNYALSRRVIPVSPNTLYAYLYTIVLGLRGLQIEQHAVRIIARLNQLSEQFARFEDAFRGIGVHLDRATRRYDQAGRQLGRFADHLGAVLPRDGAGPAGLLVNEGEPADHAASAQDDAAGPEPGADLPGQAGTGPAEEHGAQVELPLESAAEPGQAGTGPGATSDADRRPGLPEPAPNPDLSGRGPHPRKTRRH